VIASNSGPGWARVFGSGGSGAEVWKKTHAEAPATANTRTNECTQREGTTGFFLLAPARTSPWALQSTERIPRERSPNRSAS